MNKKLKLMHRFSNPDLREYRWDPDLGQVVSLKNPHYPLWLKWWSQGQSANLQPKVSLYTYTQQPMTLTRPQVMAMVSQHLDPLLVEPRQASLDLQPPAEPPTPPPLATVKKSTMTTGSGYWVWDLNQGYQGVQWLNNHAELQLWLNRHHQQRVENLRVLVVKDREIQQIQVVGSEYLEIHQQGWTSYRYQLLSARPNSATAQL